MTNHDDPTVPRGRRAPRSRPYWMLLAIPYLWSVAAIPAVGKVHTSPWAVPFLLWWMLGGVLVTTGVLALVWRMDERRELDAEGSAGK